MRSFTRGTNTHVTVIKCVTYGQGVGYDQHYVLTHRKSEAAPNHVVPILCRSSSDYDGVAVVSTTKAGSPLFHLSSNRYQMPRYTQMNEDGSG
ncbi:hypothetical protein G5I_05396 [Acromyrmex echinatior]|uniref:Uncharacterized protein n=1 Tax=Acromyrmex echinatior TaxID=103372 RepID=F4WI74_ACREC|nr:hypothetical protein G5I_05396 [Acromyrmex echinatior]